MYAFFLRNATVFSWVMVYLKSVRFLFCSVYFQCTISLAIVLYDSVPSYQAFDFIRWLEFISADHQTRILMSKMQNNQTQLLIVLTCRQNLRPVDTLDISIISGSQHHS